MLTNQEYIDRCNIIHNYKYDYSNTSYINSRSNIFVKCPTHGDFCVNASKHISGKGCKKCSIDDGKYKEKLTQEEFINRSKTIYGEKYSYTDTFYINSKSLVEITCLMHGNFKVPAIQHINNKQRGCPKCATHGLKLTYNEFIDRVISVHGNKYNLDKIKYNGFHKKVILSCFTHGDFEIFPNRIFQGYGCGKCFPEYKFLRTSNKKTRGKYKNPKKSQATYISQAIIAHNGKFSYERTIYTSKDQKIIVTCPIHGDFEIIAHNHLYSLQGCRKCQSSYGESAAREILEKHGIRYKTQVSFSDCKYKKPLRFDFQVFKNENDFFLIEIDGQQHKKPIRFSGISMNKASEIFETNVKKDKIKNDWAKTNDIKLYRIDYEKRIKTNIVKESVLDIIGKEF